MAAGSDRNERGENKIAQRVKGQEATPGAEHIFRVPWLVSILLDES